MMDAEGRMHVDLIGMGMGDAGSLTLEARDALLRSQLIIGSKRMLEVARGLMADGHDAGASDADGCGAAFLEAVTADDVRSALQDSPAVDACVLCSGDTGFFSLATSLRDTLPQTFDVRTVCGVTTVQYLAARLGRPWQGCALASAHGVACDVLGEVLAHPDTFFLTGGAITPSSIACELDDAGLGDTELAVADRLSYPDERIVVGSAAELRTVQVSGLSSVWVRRRALRTPQVEALIPLAGGIPDDAFLRGNTPMTKHDVREAIIAALDVRSGQTVFDIGAGTGSISIELALASPHLTVYAIESDPEALDLLQRNRVRFGAYNIRVISGLAPEALDALPSPDAAFIGGSRGRFDAIMDAVLLKNASARIVASAVTMETLSEAISAFLARHDRGILTDPEMKQIQVSTTRMAGSYHLLGASNPVSIISAKGMPA